MNRSKVLGALAAAAVLAGSVATGALISAHADVTPSPVVEIDHGNWVCNTPQAGTIVIVHNATRNDGVTPDDAVHLAEGCTGDIKSIIVDGTQQDGIKVGGANDLTIESGGVWCGPTKAGIVHQDGIQAMAGTNVTFRNFVVRCPAGNNGGIWIDWNKAAAAAATRAGTALPSIPTNIVCDNCDLANANAAVHVGSMSTGSGAINSTLHEGTGNAAPADCFRVDAGKTDYVDTNNVCVAAP